MAYIRPFGDVLISHLPKYTDYRPIIIVGCSESNPMTGEFAAGIEFTPPSFTFNLKRELRRAILTLLSRCLLKSRIVAVLIIPVKFATFLGIGNQSEMYRDKMMGLLTMH